MDKRLIADLRKRTLAELAVFMTICGIGAFICAVVFAGVLSGYLSGVALFCAAACLWLSLMSYLWLHFFHARRRTPTAPTAPSASSSTHLFHTIQCVALGFAAIPLVLSHGSGWAVSLFLIISLGVEAALSAFFFFYFVLAVTLGQRIQRTAIIGLAFSVVGFCLSFRYIIKL